MKIIFLPFLAAAALSSNLAVADCTAPNDVQLPDGATAEMDDMVKAQQAVKNYVAEGEAFLICLEREHAELGEETTAEIKAEFAKRHNAVVDKMSSVAEEFNKQIKAFKAATE